MAGQSQQPIVSPRNSRPDPQTPVANMVEGRINALMQEKSYLIDKLADVKLRHEGLERKFNDAKEMSQAKFKELEDMLEQLRTENETVTLLNVCSCPLAAESMLTFVLGISKMLGYRTRNWPRCNQSHVECNTSGISTKPRCNKWYEI